MGAGVYFGNREKQVYIPGPRSGADFSQVGRSSVIQLGGGGAIVEDSLGTHREATFEWVGDPALIKIVREFAQGMHGPGPFWWTDPFAADTNLFAPQWATPRLSAEGDWPAIFDTLPTGTAATGTNTQGYPGRAATYDLAAVAANAVPLRRFTVLIPNGFSLALGFAGTVTGTAVVAARALLNTGAYGAATNFTPVAPSSTTSFQTVNAFPYSAGNRLVEVYLTRTTSAASTITLAAMRARLVRDTETLATTGIAFESGEGSTGLAFSGGVKETLYTVGKAPTVKRRKGFLVRLVETEAWEQ